MGTFFAKITPKHGNGSRAAGGISTTNPNLRTPGALHGVSSRLSRHDYSEVQLLDGHKVKNVAKITSTFNFRLILGVSLAVVVLRFTYKTLIFM